jgi:hypothetical protein
LRKSVVKEARTELGPAIELVKIGDVATIEYLEKELSSSTSSAISSSQPLLEAAE